MVTGSNFLDCQGVYYITYDTIVDETSTGEPNSNRPVYQSIKGDRYIYYRSDQGNLQRGVLATKSLEDRHIISIYLHMISFQLRCLWGTFKSLWIQDGGLEKTMAMIQNAFSMQVSLKMKYPNY